MSKEEIWQSKNYKFKSFPVLKCILIVNSFSTIYSSFLFLIVCPVIGLSTFLGNFGKFKEISLKLYVGVLFYFFPGNFLEIVCPGMYPLFLEVRAEIQKYFRSFFGTNENFKICFRD